MNKTKTIKFIDLFAGIGGTRIGFEQACKELNLKPKCVFTSEIKTDAISVYKRNFRDEKIYGDITKINEKDIPDFNFLLAGFPCQPFSSAGSRKGFMDTRGTLFFDIERIIKEKNPDGFLLENVEGLVNHDRVSKKAAIGRTLETILKTLENLGYKVSWKVLNAAEYGVPQKRKRIYILGRKDKLVNLNDIEKEDTKLEDILEKNLPPLQSDFTKRLLNNFKLDDLRGKSIKDKRGGTNNIHSWEIEIKGPISQRQKQLLNRMLTERRKKKWAELKGIQWMDGMPLTLKEIESFWNDGLFHNNDDLKSDLEDLVKKGYLKFEYPKDIVEQVDEFGNVHRRREYRKDLEKGYNIVTGKLSFEVSKILDPEGKAPTLVATDLSRIFVPDNMGIRRLSERECLRLFGFPEEFTVGLPEKNLYDLLGNTVVVSVIKKVSLRLLSN